MKALIKNIRGIEIKNMPPLHEHEVLLKVDTVGLCRTDLLVARNKIPTKINELILGHEFSARVESDSTGTFIKGQWVGVNPLWSGEFMGLDFQGAICEYISVPKDKVIPTSSTDPRLIAYLEPVAASMAVLKVLGEKNIIIDKNIAIVGKNRIAYLTHTILKSQGFNVDCIAEDEVIPQNHYDFIIETVFAEDVIKKIINGLKEGGVLIVKSRKKIAIGLIASDLVAKEITLKAVNYYDFPKSMRWLEENCHLVQELLGRVYSLNQWSEAFQEAESNDQKKIFIKV